MFESLPAARQPGSRPHAVLLSLFPLAVGLHQILLGWEFPMASLEPEVGFQGKPEGRSRLVL